MKVELLEDWMGRPQGTIINLTERLARSIIGRGVAVEYEKKGSKPNKILRRPDKNKMMESYLEK